MRSTNLGLTLLSVAVSFAFAGILFSNLSWIVLAVAFSSGYIYAQSRFSIELKRSSLRIERRSLDDMVFADQPAGIKLEVLNTGSSVIRGEVEDMIPDGCQLGTGTNRTDRPLPPETMLSLTYSVIPQKRGPHVIGGVRIRRTDDLGLFSDEQIVGEQMVINAHTKKDSFEAARRMAGRQHLEFAGISRQLAVVLREQEFDGIREYTPGDRARDIHWKLYTKLMKMMTKTYRKEGSLHTMIFVDCGRSMRLRQSSVAKVDHAIDLSMQLANVLLSSFHPVGVAAFDEISVIGKTQPALGRTQFDRIVKALRSIPGSIEPSEESEGQELVPEAPEKGAMTIREIVRSQPEAGAAFLTTIEKMASSGKKRSLGLGLEGAIKELAAIRRGEGQLVIVVTDLLSSRDAVIVAAETCKRTGKKMLVIHTYDEWYREDGHALTQSEVEDMYVRLQDSIKVEATLRRYGASYIRVGPADTTPQIVRAVRGKKV